MNIGFCVAVAMFIYSSYHKQTAMSHVSEDEKAKQTLKEWKAFNDSKESNSPKEKKEVPKNDEYNEYEVNDKDPLEEKTMDDSDW